jgi:hypothetical protein
MSNAKCLHDKLQNFLQKTEPERIQLQSKRAGFNETVMSLFNRLEEMLGSTNGIALTTCPIRSFANSSTGFMEIHILDKTIKLQPNEIEGRFYLNISGLSDKDLDFTIQDDGIFSTEDNTTSHKLYLTDDFILEKLCALVPEA